MNFNWFKNNVERIEPQIINEQEKDNLLNQIKMGQYPKSFNESNMFRIISDRLAEQHPFNPDAIKIIYCYDQILKLENYVKNKSLPPETYQKIMTLGGIDSYFAMYFMMVRTLMIRLKIRDDFMFMNDDLHRRHLKHIKSLINQI